MPASLFHETEDNHSLGSTTAGNGIVEDQRALQLALELSILGLTDWDSMGANFNEADNRTTKKSQNTTECVPVPSSEHVAEIVGRQGCKIKALRAKTNTYIKTPVRGEEPVFVVTGRKEDVCAAKREILSAAEHFSQIRAQRKNNLNGGLAGPGPNSNIPGQTTIQVRVPYRVVGLVVGPKGATIKRIQQQTNTYIITPSRDKEPIFEVTGLPDSVETARKEIEAHIAMRTGGVIDSSSGNGSISPSNGDLGDNGLDSFGLGGSPHVFDDGQFSLYKGAFDIARKKMEAMRRGSMLGGDSSSGGGSISPPNGDLGDNGLDSFGLGGSPHAFDDGQFSLFKNGPFDNTTHNKKALDALRRSSMLGGDSSSGSSISPSNADLNDGGLEPFGLGGSPHGFDEGQFSLYKGAYEAARKKMEAMTRRGSGVLESSSATSSISPSNGDLTDSGVDTSPEFDGSQAGAFSNLYKTAFESRKKQNETQQQPAMQRRGSSTLDSDFQMYYGY